MAADTPKARVQWFPSKMRTSIGLTGNEKSQIRKAVGLAVPERKRLGFQSETTETTIYVIFIGDHL